MYSSLEVGQFASREERELKGEEHETCAHDEARLKVFRRIERRELLSERSDRFLYRFPGLFEVGTVLSGAVHSGYSRC